MNRILIIDDDKELCVLIKQSVLSENIEADFCNNGREGLQKLKETEYQLVILDIMMPGIDGFDIMEYIRPMEIPVIFITAKYEVRDRVKGLKLGADDYLVKPFDVVELVARVEAVLRRYNKTERRLSAGDVVVDVEARTVKKAGRPVELTNKEFLLLVLFLRNRNVALFRETLYEKVWEGEYSGDSRTLDLHVQRLRKKLNWENGEYPRLVAVYKVGYRLEVGR